MLVRILFLFLTFRLITYFIDNFTLGMKSKSVDYLLSGSEHIYSIWALKSRCTQYEFCKLGNLQICRTTLFFEVMQGNQCFPVGSIKVSMELPKLWVTGPTLIQSWDSFLKNLVGDALVSSLSITKTWWPGLDTHPFELDPYHICPRWKRMQL